MTVDIILIKDVSGDWEALYVNGKLAEEGHSLDITNVLMLLVGSTVRSYYSFEYDFAYSGIGKGYDIIDKYHEIDMVELSRSLKV
jgi:hypothetical protein